MTENELSLEYGHAIRNDFYLLDKSIKFTNHGSYGAVPKTIFMKKQELQLEMEKAPDAWFRVKNVDLWNLNRNALAKYLNINDENLVLCENATDAINSILKSISENYTNNDVILAHEYTYQAVLNTIDYVSKYRKNDLDKINIYKVEFKYPIKSINDLLDVYEKACEDIIINKKLNIRLVIADHISSATAILFPLNEIIKIIRKWEAVQTGVGRIKILIDAAHAIGQIKIDLNNLDCDYYVSNLHKWFLAPRGCAFLYYKNRDDTYKLTPNIISHGYMKGAIKNYLERATRDSTSWYLINDCIDIYENKFRGLNNIEKYVSNLLLDAVKILESSWGTTRLQIPNELEAPFMKIVKMPKLKPLEILNGVDISQYPPILSNYLQDNFNVDTQITIIQNEVYCRISGFVYNVIDDYFALRDAIIILKSD